MPPPRPPDDGGSRRAVDSYPGRRPGTSVPGCPNKAPPPLWGEIKSRSRRRVPAYDPGLAGTSVVAAREHLRRPRPLSASGFPSRCVHGRVSRRRWSTTTETPMPMIQSVLRPALHSEAVEATQQRSQVVRDILRFEAVDNPHVGQRDAPVLLQPTSNAPKHILAGNDLHP